MQIRDRIKEFRRVKACELAPNPKNWRTHPESQRNALKGVLAEVGIAAAALAYERPDGTLMLIDGHLRTETLPEQELPVLVLDVTEEEADKLLLSFDPLSGMAGTSEEHLSALLGEVETQSAGLQAMLDELAKDAGVLPGDLADLPNLPGEGVAIGDQEQDLANVNVGVGPYRTQVSRVRFDAWLEEVRQKVGFEKAIIAGEILRRLGLG